MKKFIKDVGLFLLPLMILGVLLIPFIYAAKSTGEFEDIEKNAIKQRNNSNVLVGMGYNEQTPFYKLFNVNYYEPDVIALGTSRVMEFKEFFFSAGFYNCGGAVSGGFDEYKNFLVNLTYKPEVIILGIDSWVFNDEWNSRNTHYTQMQEIKKTDRKKIGILVSIINDWVNKKWSFEDLWNYGENIGFNGRIKDEGFMYDGSYYYGYIYRDPKSSRDYEFYDTLSRIENGNGRLEWGDHIDQEAIDQLEELLRYCKENDIEVVGFVTPFAPSIYSKMKNTGKYGYLSEIMPACQTLFAEYSFEVYDYEDGGYLEVGDEFFIDGFHGSEIVYGKILNDMIDNGSIIKDYVDYKKINEMVENTYSGLVFENPDDRR